MRLKFLGTHNAESRDTGLASLLIDGILALDAGSLVSGLTFPEQARIKAIMLTHGHYDHIRAVPAFAYNNSDRSTRVVATPPTLDILATHLMDGTVYPRFTERETPGKQPVIEFIPVEFHKRYNIEGYEISAVPVNHPLDAAGFEIGSAGGQRLFYTGDTGPGLSAVWEEISPRVLIIDVTWPDRLREQAATAGHLCPSLLEKEMLDFRRIRGYLPRVAAVHLSPLHRTEIEKELEAVAGRLKIPVYPAREGDELDV